MSARVFLSDHAFSRWPQRGGRPVKRTKLQAMMAAKVRNALAQGMRLDKTGAGMVRVDRYLWAVVRPVEIGWVVTTFVRR